MPVDKKLPEIVYAEKELQALMQNFIGNRVAELNEIEAAINNKQWSEVQRVAHIAAGVSGSYGLDEYGELAAEIEACAVAQSKEKILDLLKIMRDYLGIVKIVFK